jgi:[acyl-carrier-protein] S-malonyltransferase
MGKSLYDQFPSYRQAFEEASDLLGDDMAKIVFASSEGEMTETRVSQVAIFLTSAATLRVLRHELPDLAPIFTAGLSLGEYTALYASGKMAFGTTLQLVKKRGAAMQEACLRTPGTMRVVLGLTPEAIRPLLPEGTWIANLNCPGQVVIAGRKEAILAAEDLLAEAGAKRVLPLDVSGAFHTPLMQSAADLLRPEILNAAVEETPVQLVMNVPGEVVSAPEEIRKNLILQVVSPTLWEKGIRTMMALGADQWLEIGPGKTLTGMNRKIGGFSTLNLETPADLKILETAYVA